MFADTQTIHELAGAGRLIDVRSEAEYASCHIVGALNIPLPEFERQIQRLAKIPGPVVITCQSGQRSEKARQLMLTNGCTTAVMLVEGGTQGWRNSGGEVLLGKKMVSIERQVRMVAGGLVAAGSVAALIVSPAWSSLPLLVGSGLLIAGATDTCLMGTVLSRMPWNRTGQADKEKLSLAIEALCISPD